MENETREQIIARARRQGVSPETIRELRTMNDAMSVAEIAKLFGITSAGVYHHINGNRRILGMDNRERAKKIRPFAVPSAQQKCNQYNMLSAHILQYIDPESLSAPKLKALTNWQNGLRAVPSLILVHDPEQEPNDVAKCGGWRYEERTSEDGGLVVRCPEPPTDEQREALTLDGLEA